MGVWASRPRRSRSATGETPLNTLLRLRLLHMVIAVCTITTAAADEDRTHHFDTHGTHQAAGFPDQTHTSLAVAEKTVTLTFAGLAAHWNPTVHIHRITSAREIVLDPVEAQLTGDIWQITWTPPKTRGPAKYLIHLDGDPKRTVRIESRPATWIESTCEALAKSDWEAHGLTPEERQALADLGIRTRLQKSTTTFLELRPRQGNTAHRRIVWDTENPHLLVWRPGPVAGDLEARAPRWWISPAALATDHGLIRFLDLYTEPPLNP